MAKQSRDQRLAAEMRAKHGTSYQSASDRAAKRTASPTPGASDAEIYDQVRATPASADRRSRAKSEGTISRWRRGVKPEWNR